MLVKRIKQPIAAIISSDQVWLNETNKQKPCVCWINSSCSCVPPHLGMWHGTIKGQKGKKYGAQGNDRGVHNNINLFHPMLMNSTTQAWYTAMEHGGGHKMVVVEVVKFVKSNKATRDTRSFDHTDTHAHRRVGVLALINQMSRLDGVATYAI